MKSKVNVINFPDRIKQRRDEKAKIYTSIRDEIESVLNKYSRYYNDTICQIWGTYMKEKFTTNDLRDSINQGYTW